MFTYMLAEACTRCVRGKVATLRLEMEEPGGWLSVPACYAPEVRRHDNVRYNSGLAAQDTATLMMNPASRFCQTKLASCPESVCNQKLPSGTITFGTQERGPQGGTLYPSY